MSNFPEKIQMLERAQGEGELSLERQFVAGCFSRAIRNDLRTLIRKLLFIPAARGFLSELGEEENVRKLVFEDDQELDCKKVEGLITELRLTAECGGPYEQHVNTLKEAVERMRNVISSTIYFSLKILGIEKHSWESFDECKNLIGDMESGEEYPVLPPSFFIVTEWFKRSKTFEQGKEIHDYVKSRRYEDVDSGERQHVSLGIFQYDIWLSRCKTGEQYAFVYRVMLEEGMNMERIDYDKWLSLCKTSACYKGYFDALLSEGNGGFSDDFWIKWYLNTHTFEEVVDWLEGFASLGLSPDQRIRNILFRYFRDRTPTADCYPSVLFARVEKIVSKFGGRDPNWTAVRSSFHTILTNDYAM